MFFGQEYIAFEILEVLSLDMSGSKAFNHNRNFDALSFRFEADTVLTVSGKETALTENSLCYVPSNVNYTRDSVKDNLIVVHFKSFNYHSNEIEHFYPGNPEKYRESFRTLLDCWNNRGIGYKNECAAIFSKILADIYRDSKNIIGDSKIAKSVLYIEQNCLKRDFSLEIAAEKSFMSETYFRKLFKKELGVSPKQYVIEKRMEYAKGLLVAGYFSIREIAFQCGYNDEKHFSSEFKKHTGVSPSAYIYNF